METHIIGFSGDLYGSDMTVSLLRFLRPEKKFGTAGELAEAVRLNIEDAKAFDADSPEK